ncbi:hypothetical protein DM860_012589 [Cuscuta australis]|uniref:Uncharacterized protein n=1 Tax=Cuscuta australis TaxID=267555 RepID=A0A328DFW6_9ASTE|nr:hypothetical protein DM860_012589 [Cuscuta australis]
MVGRVSGMRSVHTNAKMTTAITSSTRCPLGVESLWSSNSFKSVSLDNSVASDSEYSNSPGCLPIITSNATTPKLLLHHMIGIGSKAYLEPYSHKSLQRKSSWMNQHSTVLMCQSRLASAQILSQAICYLLTHHDAQWGESSRGADSG